MRVIVVGSGIAGLTAAVALRKIGADVTVYERAAALGDVGAGISLWANAFRALEHLGVADAVRAVSLPMTVSELYGGNGHRLLARIPAEVLARRMPAPPAVGVAQRPDLVAALAARLPPDVMKFGFECVAADTAEDRATVRFANGHADTADLVLGADGIKSVVRAAVVGTSDPPRYSGYTCWRGVCPRPAGLAPGAMSERWGRGKRFGVTTTPGDRVYWFATANVPAGQRGDEPKLVAEAFAGWADPVPELIATTPPSAVLRNDIVDRPPDRRWVRGRLLLVGDAAHPTTPNLGQGGCLAIEDAVVLARCLRGKGTVAEQLAAFVAERFPRAAAVNRESWRLGRVGQWRGRASCWLRDRLVALLVAVTGPFGLARHAMFDVGPVGLVE